MGETLVLAQGIGVVRAGDVLAFPAAIPQATSKQIPGSAEDLIRNISGVLENMAQSVISQQTGAEFRTMRDGVFPAYADAALALSKLLGVVLTRATLERLNRELFCELEADLRDRGLQSFGAPVRDQAMFTVWTLRKISDYLSQIANGAASAANTNQFTHEKLTQFIQLANECVHHALRTRFHLHCLMSSMTTGIRIHSDAFDLVIDGLRSGVNAFALTRKLLDIVVPLPETGDDAPEWDEEDEALLREASLDAVGDAL